MLGLLGLGGYLPNQKCYRNRICYNSCYIVWYVVCLVCWSLVATYQIRNVTQKCYLVWYVVCLVCRGLVATIPDQKAPSSERAKRSK